MPDAPPALYAECATCDPEFRVYDLADLRWTPAGRLTCPRCWEIPGVAVRFDDLRAPVASLWPPSGEAPPAPWAELVRRAYTPNTTLHGAVLGRVVRLKSHPLDAMTVTAATPDMGNEVEVAFMVEGQPRRTLLPMAALTDWSADDL